ncbi:MAG TPA: tetratricopeptide repeat protein, partial [Anaerolineae bacterium]|nr:tetratricopeptide repeat protein [Anaerolineae bacterium]
MTISQEPSSPTRAARANRLSLRAGSLWLLAASALIVILLVITQSANVADRVRLARAGQPLAEALLLRQRTGDLPGGPGAPGIYALARAAGEGAGTAAVRRGEIERDLRVAAEALADVPGGQRLSGIALGSLGQYSSAEQQLQNVAQDDLFAALALGNVLDEQGRLDAARGLWQPSRAERALSLQLYRAGAALASQGRREQAEALLLRAIAIDPANANAYHALGGFYWGPDRERSLEMYRIALAVGGLEPFFERFAAGRVAFLEGRLEDAVAALEEAVRLNPEHSDALVLLGTTLNRLGRLPEAISYLEDAVQRSPRAFWPLVELGRLYVDLGDYDRAIEMLTTAAGRRADVAQPFELLAEAYQGAGQPQQAINAWQQAVTVSPGNAAYHARLGDALAELGRDDEAIAAYRQALAINP